MNKCNSFDVFNAFAFNNYYFSGGRVIAPTNCWTPLIQLPDGGYGNDDAQTGDPGVIVPASTSDGVHIYSFRFYDTGEWILQFGNLGDEQLPNSTQGVIQFDIAETENILLTWSDANSRYEGMDLDSATAIIPLVGTEVCFAGGIVPSTIIWYDFLLLKVRGYAETTNTVADRIFNWIKGF